MGMFDFLKGKVGPAAQASVNAIGPAGEIGPLAQPPTMQRQPNFLERGQMPGPSGLSMADRILMGLMSLNDDTRGAIAYGAGKTKTATDNHERARKNAALKKAYGPNGFDVQAFMAEMGDGGDASEALSLAKELAPSGGVDGSFAYTKDPLTGQVHWGEQREMSHAEEAQLAREAEAERRNRELEDIARGRLGVADYAAHHRVGRGGGARASVPALPAGFVMEK